MQQGERAPHVRIAQPRKPPALFGWKCLDKAADRFDE